MQTVQLLVEQRGIELRVIDIPSAGPRLIVENPGETVMWGGNHEPPVIYGEIFIMTIGEDGPPKIEKRTFDGSGTL